MAKNGKITPLIETKGLKKEFILEKGEKVTALEGADVQIFDKEFVCLLGPSGCGKSTWLRIAAGLEHATEGEVLYKGEPVSAPGKERGMVFQEYSLLPWRSVADNVTLGPEFGGLSHRERKEAAADYLSRVGLENFADAKPHELSGGMRQRAAIARALANNPDVLLMDEPFGALDAITRDNLNNVLLEIWESTRKTVIFVTHSISEAVYLSDRIIVMGTKPGRVIADMKVELPRPRNEDSKLTPEFYSYVKELREMLK